MACASARKLYLDDTAMPVANLSWAPREFVNVIHIRSQGARVFHTRESYRLSDKEQLDWVAYYCRTHTSLRKSKTIIKRSLAFGKELGKDTKPSRRYNFRAVYYFYLYTHWFKLAIDERKQLQESLKICAEQKACAERERRVVKTELQASNDTIFFGATASRLSIFNRISSIF